MGQENELKEQRFYILFFFFQNYDCKVTFSFLIFFLEVKQEKRKKQIKSIFYRLLKNLFLKEYFSFYLEQNILVFISVTQKLVRKTYKLNKRFFFI